MEQKKYSNEFLIFSGNAKFIPKEKKSRALIV